MMQPYLRRLRCNEDRMHLCNYIHTPHSQTPALHPPPINNTCTVPTPPTALHPLTSPVLHILAELSPIMGPVRKVKLASALDIVVHEVTRKLAEETREDNAMRCDVRWYAVHESKAAV